MSTSRAVWVFGAVIMAAALTPAAQAQSALPHARTQMGRVHAHDPVWPASLPQKQAKVYYQLVPPPEVCVDATWWEIDSVLYGSRDRVSRIDFHDSMGSTYVIRREYDQQGNLIRREAIQHDFAGIDYNDVVECAYDSRNLLIRKTSTSQGTDSLFRMEYRATYNARGQYETETFEVSKDGVPYLNAFVKYVYDDRHFLVLRTKTWDTGADGVSD